MSLAQKIMTKDPTDRQYKSIAFGVFVQSFFTLISRIFGMIRDMIMLHVFGAGIATDSFLIAFTIPNVLRRFFAEGALSTAFVPVYLDTKQNQTKDEAKEFFQDTFGLLLLTLIFATILGVIFSPFLVKLFAYGFLDNKEQFALTNNLTKWLFPYVLFVSLVALFGGYMQCYRIYAPMAAAPIFLNLSIIICVMLFPKFFAQKIYVLALGVIAGGLIQFAFMVYFLKLHGLWFWPRFRVKTQAMKTLLKLLLPSLFGVFVYQLNIIVLRQLASFLGEGQVTYYYNADRLTQLVTGVFIVSIASAILPELSQDAAKDGGKKLGSLLKFSLKTTSFIITPCSLGLMFFSFPIVSIIYFHGAFSYTDCRQTSVALLGFAPSLIFFGFSRNLMQAFYALKNTTLPVVAGGIAVIVNIVVGLLLLDFGILGLATTLSISSFVQFCALRFFLQKYFSQQVSLGFSCSFFVHLGISLIACGVGVWVQKLGRFHEGTSFYNTAVLALMAFLCSVTYLGFSLYFKVPESNILLSVLKKKLLK